MYLEITPTAGLTADPGVPAGATAGVPVRSGSPEQGTMREYNSCMALVELSGTGAISSIVELWWYHTRRTQWCLIARGEATPDTAPGRLNGGTAISGTTLVEWAERIDNFSAFDRVYARAVGMTGTGVTLKVFLVRRTMHPVEG
jgi:hypothetical protein